MVSSRQIVIRLITVLYRSCICRTLTPGHDAVQKVTLIPRGQARGLTWFIPSDDPTLISRQQLFARIVGGLGGRAAEEIIFGEPEVTTGAAGDLQQITGLAKQVTLLLSILLLVNMIDIHGLLVYRSRMKSKEKRGLPLSKCEVGQMANVKCAICYYLYCCPWSG